jgi:RNA polymerase sigma-70 factor (ECF subfamily)
LAKTSLLILAIASSLCVGQATTPSKAGGKELALDDGKSAGRKSIAGSGHAVKVEAPADGCRLIAVKIYGSRYGTPQPPAEDFHVYVCDADGNQVADFAFPYKTFLRGEPRWVTLKIADPPELPAEFFICVGFDPAQTKGVYVHHDRSHDGDSRSGLPGSLDEAFGQGDWMIRAVIAEP